MTACQPVPPAAAVNADHTNTDRVVGADHPAGGLRAGDGKPGCNAGGGRGVLEKCTACLFGHSYLLLLHVVMEFTGRQWFDVRQPPGGNTIIRPRDGRNVKYHGLVYQTERR